MKETKFHWKEADHWFTIKLQPWLDVGCGNNKHIDCLGIDKRQLEGVDLVHDVENIPWPFKDESCSMILLNHLIEHIKPWLTIDFMNECWRVLEFNGLLILVTPYGFSLRHFQDPTHCNPWVESTPFYFVPGNNLYDIYKPKQWTIEKLIYAVDGDLGVAMRKIEDISPETEKEVRNKWKHVYMGAKKTPYNREIMKVHV